MGLIFSHSVFRKDKIVAFSEVPWMWVWKRSWTGMGRGRTPRSPRHKKIYSNCQTDGSDNVVTSSCICPLTYRLCLRNLHANQVPLAIRRSLSNPRSFPRSVSTFSPPVKDPTHHSYPLNLRFIPPCDILVDLY